MSSTLINSRCRKIEENDEKTRKIGLGVMGFRRYAADVGDYLMIPKGRWSWWKMWQVLSRRSPPKPPRNWPQSAACFRLLRAANMMCLTAPGQECYPHNDCPTGTLSIIAGCSGGIEPLFALVYTRNILDGTKMIEANPCFEDTAKKADFTVKN